MANDSTLFSLLILRKCKCAQTNKILIFYLLQQMNPPLFSFTVDSLY